MLLMRLTLHQDIWTIFYFDNMVSQIYPFELQLNKANTMESVSVHSFAFLEHLAMLLNSALAINC